MRPSREAKVTFVECPERRWTHWLVRREANRAAVPVVVARKAVARKAGLPPGTVENIDRGRAKRIERRVFEALRGLVIRELEREITAHQHELAVCRQCGLDAREDTVGEVETHLAAARKAMEALK